MLPRAFPLVALALLAACGDESVNPATPSTGGAGGASSTSSTGGAGGEAPPPIPPGPAEPLAVPSWWVATVNASGDPVVDELDAGTMELPTDGYLGLSWQSVVPGENHELTDSFTDYIYAVAEIDVPEGHRVFARGDTVLAFYVDNAARQPGDFYHTRSMRVPLPTQSDRALVVVRALGRRNTPEVELWSTRAEVELNPLDLTFPHLVVGSDEALPLGLPILVLDDEPVTDLQAEVVESDLFEATTTSWPSLAPGASTQISFDLQPKAPWAAPDEVHEVTLRVSGPSLDWTYETTVELETRAADAHHRITRRSFVDGSTQYMGIMPPSAPTASPGLLLSLHGASVQAIGQAQAYSPKDWAYLVAPTNRRPYGFDWEEWGRLDAIEALDFAQQRFGIDTSRVHLTGHSMGGHGSWHVGVHFADHFGVIAPSAGWISFEEYTGPAHPTGPIGRARAASQTLDYVGNLTDRSVYIIHGSSDDNVPVSHAQQMFSTLTPTVSELAYHEEAGARHWWDLDGDEPGADCVDWEPMVTVAEQRMVDPLPLSFTWTSPGPWVNHDHSFVSLRAATSPMVDVVVTSAVNGTALDVNTTNVRAMDLDGDALTQAGITALTVDGAAVSITAGSISIGPQDGKHPTQYGPLNQLFHRPFCFVWDDAGPAAFPRYAAWLLSWWTNIGNGHGCGVPLSQIDAVSDHNLVYLGVPSAALPGAPSLPITFDGSTIGLNGQSYEGAVAFLFPDGDKLAGLFAATPGNEHLLFRYTMFSSRGGMPDWLVWQEDGLVATGFFDATWQLEPAFSTGL